MLRNFELELVSPFPEIDWNAGHSRGCERKGYGAVQAPSEKQPCFTITMGSGPHDGFPSCCSVMLVQTEARRCCLAWFLPAGLYWSRLLDPVGVGGRQINLGKGLGLAKVFSCCYAVLLVWIVPAVLVHDWVIVEGFGVWVWCLVLRRDYVSPSCWSLKCK
ncbi:hypothetical protein RHMOL_Rhmol12G0019600 [Rhododendron molle]|uniref:Uncharacterized protein n=1 Tax=Rhododendron molle TaxID=49168 RepID=A0ACC0LDY2_RHOML|nr:hypothetical protein RHMOL_Rhmol12G0019600 [Rhododendron molle]